MSKNLVSIEELASQHKRSQRLFGVDLGTKTIGLALSDVGLSIASAYSVIKRTKFTSDANALVEFCKKEDVYGLVLGLPLNMDGSEGPRVQATRAFARNLERILPLPILLWDERLSTVTAERVLIEADMSRRKRAEKIDAVAASVILQAALDRLSVLRRT